jgi:hypothetical protein
VEEGAALRVTDQVKAGPRELVLAIRHAVSLA